MLGNFEILLAIATLVTVALLMRPFDMRLRILFLLIILVRFALMWWLTTSLIRQTGSPLNFDAAIDDQKYYYQSAQFATKSPFDITINDCIAAADGSRQYGYHCLLVILWTLTPNPILPAQFLKEALFFCGLVLLARTWLRMYGRRLAAIGLFFLATVFTPAFYYNYRNQKDGLLLGLFLLIMATVDYVFWLQANSLATRRKMFTLWLVAGTLIYAVFVIRLYTGVIILVALLLHVFMASRLRMVWRLVSLASILAISLIALQLGLVRDALELGESVSSPREFEGVFLLQGFLSPLPWNDGLPAGLAVYYWVYWLLLPYALVALARNFRKRVGWHLFLYVMIYYIVAGPVGDPPRKRLIVHPILVSWILADWHSRRRATAGGGRLAQNLGEVPMVRVPFVVPSPESR